MLTAKVNGNSIRQSIEQVHGVVAVYCKLFSDTITAGVCVLRKQELNGRGGFSCTGCTMEKC